MLPLHALRCRMCATEVDPECVEEKGANRCIVEAMEMMEAGRSSHHPGTLTAALIALTVVGAWQVLTTPATPACCLMSHILCAGAV